MAVRRPKLRRHRDASSSAHQTQAASISSENSPLVSLSLRQTFLVFIGLSLGFYSHPLLPLVSHPMQCLALWYV